VHLEPDVQITGEMGQAVINAILELARFLNATAIDYPHHMPQGWKHLIS
jgi:hypothetical protein